VGFGVARQEKKMRRLVRVGFPLGAVALLILWFLLKILRKRYFRKKRQVTPLQCYGARQSTSPLAICCSA